MAIETVLEMFKADLGISHTAKDSFFRNIIISNKSDIESKGITIDLESVEDIVLLCDYSLWNYKKRNEDAGLSRNLSLRIRNRIVKERAEIE